MVSSPSTTNNIDGSLPSTISSNGLAASTIKTTQSTPNNSNGTLPSTISSSETNNGERSSELFEKSKILLQNMIDTIMPVDSSPDYLSSLTLSASSFKDNQGNNPLHELVTSFWKSRLSSISALTQTMNIINDNEIKPSIQSASTTNEEPSSNVFELTFPIISVPALIPLEYIITDNTVSKTPVETSINLSELTISIRPYSEQRIEVSQQLTRAVDVKPVDRESIQSQPTRKSILFINKEKTPTITIFHSSEKSFKLSADTLTTITKASGIDKQFARDFFTQQTSAYSSVEELFKTLMETDDGQVELPFSEFKNQTNDQGFYPIDTFIDFMTTYERYLVDNFKFKTANKELENFKDEYVLRFNKSAPGKMQGLTNILLLLTPDEDVLKETDEKTITQEQQAENVVVPAVVTQDTSEKDGVISEYKTKMLTITKKTDGIIELTMKIPEKIVTPFQTIVKDSVATQSSLISIGDIFYVISGSFTYNNDGIPVLNVDNRISTTTTTDTSPELNNYDVIDLSNIINDITTNQIINKDSSLLRMIELLLSPSGETKDDEYKILKLDIIEKLKNVIMEKIQNISEKYEFKLIFKKVVGNDSLVSTLYIRIVDETQKILSNATNSLTSV